MPAQPRLTARAPACARRRCLRGWLCRPLARAADIVARQDAVAELLGPAAGALQDARAALAGASARRRPALSSHAGRARRAGGHAASLGAANAGRAAPTARLSDARAPPGVGELERTVARLHGTSRRACMRDTVVLYEDAARRHVTALLAALRGLQAAAAAFGAFAAPPASGVLRALTHGGAAAAFAGPLERLAGAADWDAAKTSGRITPPPVRRRRTARGQNRPPGCGGATPRLTPPPPPLPRAVRAIPLPLSQPVQAPACQAHLGRAQGVNDIFDAAEEAIVAAEAGLTEYAADMRRRLGTAVTFVAIQKESHLLEVPEVCRPAAACQRAGALLCGSAEPALPPALLSFM